MKALPLLCLAGLAAASCGSPGPGGGSSEFAEVKTRDDLDRYAGKDVTVEGTFDHLHAQHAKVTLASGLVIYIPHFDRFRRGDDWLKYVGHHVRVEGILHTYSSVIPEISGPIIDVRHFEAIESTE
ncbi:MAG TPA: hypothetical protein VK661_13020 [Planctomycetota bacterium]|jgi:hypothetical protein|nr:hypothetical protein [Planctomycetota bacterium]